MVLPLALVPLGAGFAIASLADSGASTLRSVSMISSTFPTQCHLLASTISTIALFPMSRLASSPSSPGESSTCTYPLVCATRLRPSLAVSITHTLCLVPTSRACGWYDSRNAVSSLLRRFTSAVSTLRMRAAGVPGRG